MLNRILRSKYLPVILLFLSIGALLSIYLWGTKKDYEKDILALVINVIANILIFYALRNYIVKELTNLNLKEIPYFNEEDFFSDIRKSRKQVLIVDTYLESLLNENNNNISKLMQSIEDLISNANQGKQYCKIKILVLDPNCRSINQRLADLYEYYINDSSPISREQYLSDMRLKLENQILTLNDLRVSITRKMMAITKSHNYDFDIYIGDFDLTMSIYASDKIGYFGFMAKGIPTTKNNQLVCSDVVGSIYGKNNIENFYKMINSNQVIGIEDYCAKSNGLKQCEAIRQFEIISDGELNNEMRFDALLKLDPLELRENDIFFLIDYLETKYKTFNFKNEHYNMFGTGGDQFKTFNISTMAAIIATNIQDDLNVVKTGTSHITSKIGSSEFYSIYRNVIFDEDLLEKYKLDLKLKFKESDLMKFEGYSSFVSLHDLGYHYDKNLREVRRKLAEEGSVLDIYKVIFPAANLTGWQGTVTGIYDVRYVDIFERIAHHYHRNVILLHSEHYKSDELLSGKNMVYHIINNKTKDISLEIPITMKISEYESYLLESNSVDEHIGKFIQIQLGLADEDIVKTICYNVAAIMKLRYPHESLEDLAGQCFQKISIQNYK